MTTFKPFTLATIKLFVQRVLPFGFAGTLKSISAVPALEA
jgi:hypothetical protein